MDVSRWLRSASPPANIHRLSGTKTHLLTSGETNAVSDLSLDQQGF
jgi:hypothetical protein